MGRLANYKYFNMDESILSALELGSQSVCVKLFASDSRGIPSKRSFARIGRKIGRKIATDDGKKVAL